MDALSSLPKQRADYLEKQGDADDADTLTNILEKLRRIVRRQSSLLAIVLSCSFILGLVYLFTSPARYTAHTMLLIDSSKARMLQQQAPIADVPIDTAQVETQLEILKSEAIALSVIKDLKLQTEPEFIGGKGLLDSISQYFVSTDERSDNSLTRKALNTFTKDRRIARVGRTYVLDIEFSSLDPDRAAAVANAIAESYVVDQLEAKYQVTRRASGWLQDRIKELRQQASDADRMVLDYKERNKIVEVAGTNGTSRLLGEQQLQELNTQLGNARAAASDAEAKLARVDDVLKKNVPDSAVADSLKSEVITRLRNNYLEIAAKEAMWSAKYGSDHLAAVNLRTQMNEIRRSIRDELGRIAQSYKSDYEIAKSRAEALERSLETLVANSQTTNRDRLGLRELESTAQVYHTIYDSFLQRYMEAIQQQSFPITEARVISAAVAPRIKSSPNAVFVLGSAILIGIIISFLVAILREALDGVLRTSEQVETLLNLNFLAAVPLVVVGESKSAAASSSAKALGGKRPSADAALPAASSFSSLQLPEVGKGAPEEVLSAQQNEAARAGATQDGNQREISDAQGVMRYVVEDPLSLFAEAFRSMKIAADISNSTHANQVIGVTSTLAKEGKTTISSNLAQLIAHAGRSVILLDADLRNPSLTRALAPNSRRGLLELLEGSVSLQDVIYRDGRTGLSFLPAAVKKRLPHSNEILASRDFKKLIESLREKYDYIVVDFPPIAPVVDVKATTYLADSYIFVVEWGKTRVNLIQNQLSSSPALYEKVLGVVLNKTNMKVLQRYEANYGKEYYNQYYSPYGYSS